MRKSVVFAALAGLTVSVAGVGLSQPQLAFGTELDGFAINTQDKAVTVTLFTDQRVNYTTETQGRQFAIVLPNTQVSKAQMDNGLPVVIDNKNRFIGRAVPTEDGKVKIILPNLPANEYSVSVQQKRPGQTAAIAPIATAKPHAAVTPKADSQFEKVAESFPKPVVAARPVIRQAVETPAPSTGETQSIRLSSPPKTSGTRRGGTVWNPYVVKASSVPRLANSSYGNYKPVYRPKQRPVAQQAPQPVPVEEPIKFTSLLDTQAQMDAEPKPPVFPPQIAASTPPPPPTVKPDNGNDPLWFLHALQPNQASNAPADELKGLAQEDPFIPTRPTKSEAQKPASESVSTSHGALAEIKDSVLNLPRWLLLTAMLFLGGMGVFSLIGALVLLKILFGQNKSNLQPTFILSPGMQVMTTDAHGRPIVADANGASFLDPASLHRSAYATRPEAPLLGTRPAFKDTASVNAMEYLKDSSQNITQAVQNSVLVKFPSRSRQRSTSTSRKPNPTRPTGTDSPTGIRP